MSVTHHVALRSPRIRTPLRRKKSSGGSRPISVKTLSFSTVFVEPSSSLMSTSSSRISVTLLLMSSSKHPSFLVSPPPLDEAPCRTSSGLSTPSEASGFSASASRPSRFSGLGRLNSLLR